MSLTVHAYTRPASIEGRSPADEELKLLDPASPGSDLAGFESWRHNVYGSATARALGLTLLPTLREEDLFAEGGSLDQLEVEVRTLLAHVPELVADSARRGIPLVSNAEPGPTVTFRLGNVLAAIEAARTVRDGISGVCIW